MLDIIQSTALLSPTISIEKQKELVDFIKNIKDKYPNKDQLAFICIGTDRSTGDAFGPLIGSVLVQLGFKHVYGTIDAPCDADHVEKIINNLSKTDKIVIAIDAGLGVEASIGTFIFTDKPLIPGEAVGRKLPAVGHYSIAAIVNKRGLKSYWQLQHTSLFLVYRMVFTLREAFESVWKEGTLNEANDIESYVKC